MPLAKYYKDLSKFIKLIEANGINEEKLNFSIAAEEAIALILRQNSQGGKLIFIGNGGSAAIASHMAIDYWRNGKIKATAFNEGSLLTCISNDFGYKHVFGKPIEMFADPRDVLIAISSSGRSENIINGVKAALQKTAQVITLSGFSPDNPLRKMGKLNFYLPCNAYSHIEIIHETICHYILEAIIEKRAEGKI
ncbi:MAG: SIS domain-containing protein [Candidatus Saganbacteria bacterium]|nr:SIS domain-containing protein [Candidatus Saganbacteria bacterium]